MAAIGKYRAPETLEEAVRVVAAEDATLLAGGTDLLPRWSKGLLQRPEALVSLKDVEGLRGVSRVDGEVCIGACTSLSEIASDSIIRNAAPVLSEAAGRIACPQVRNRATLGGNLCNASPAADTAVPLILLDTVLDLARVPLLSEQCSEDVPRRSQSSATPPGLVTREVSITEFFRGPGSTVLARGELLTCIRFKPLSQTRGTGVSPVFHHGRDTHTTARHGRDAWATGDSGTDSRPLPSAEAPRGLKPAAHQKEAPRGLKSAARQGVFAAWDKFGTRRAMEIAIASVGVALWVEDAVVVDARVGYGSVAPVPLRGRHAEAQLVGNLLSAEVIGKCVDAAREEIAPITDVRASAAYRREVVGVMLRRMLERARHDRQT